MGDGLKTLNVPMEESLFKRLEAMKGKRSWREFLKDLVEGKR